MSQNSKFSEENWRISEIRDLLTTPARDGKDIVRLSRLILEKYVSAGFSLDDSRIETILGIDSETDSMSLSADNADEFSHVYESYSQVFDESRQQILSTL